MRAENRNTNELGVESWFVEWCRARNPGNPWSPRLILYRFDAARGDSGKNRLCEDANDQADERRTEELDVFAGHPVFL